jgi:uncharacterized protein (TIGR01777 family)
MSTLKSSSTVLVSGATGLVGRALCAQLGQRGYRVRQLSRASGAEVRWDVAAGELAAGALDGVDCVIHLAGEPIAQRWTPAARRRILRSRVDSTQLLAREILKQAKPPAFICASGINYYGCNRSGPVNETSASGAGFLSEVCREWEGAAQTLTEAGVRTVFVRTGIVLSPEGGALAKMLPPFKFGVGGRIGSGQQFMSWISLADLVAVYCFAVESETLAGPINAVAPVPITNARFTKILGQALRRPTLLPLPAAVVTALFGEMGQETLLADLAVQPQRLQQLGFTWEMPTLERALNALLQPARA